MIRFQKKLPVLLLSIFLLPFISARVSNCNQTCGSNTVPYPFGFSAGCKIPLTCTSTKIQIGGFLVRNITFESLLLDVPPSCNRSIQSAESFFGQNYAMTRKNGLFLRNCSSAISGCVISTELISDRLDLLRCGSKGDNISCFANPKTDDFPSAAEVKATGCSFLFTSIRYEADAANLTAFVFSTVELGWWLEGDCRCSANANCTSVHSPVTGKPGFRCKCHEGFEGDGFTDGGGCLKVVSSCGSSEYMSGNCGRSTRIGLLFGGIIAGGSLIAGIALLLCIIRRRSTSTELLKSTKLLFSEASCTVPLYRYKAIERATDDFSETRRLGTGAYGTVYVGNLHNGDIVAVKKIKHPDPETIDQVMNEVKMISSVNHPNLVRLLGCCIERGEQILVYEFMPNGTLSEHLQRQRGPGLPWTVRLTIAAETAKAIAHLHSAVHPPIYHRDIKSSNILLDLHFNAKIADFGLSRTVMTEFSHISTTPQGTPGYVDPQYHQNFHLSDKSDVYSFGVVLMEIITGLKAVDFNRVQSEVILASMAVDRIGKGRVEEIIDPFLEPEKDGWILASIHKVAELAFRCLAFHRDMRPSMMEVADELEQIRLSGWAPKDGDVVVSPEVELCSSPLTDQTDLPQDVSKSRRLVLVSGRMEEKVNSPVSVQDSWVSEQSSPSTNSLLS